MLYTADVLQLVKSYQLQPQAYADDTQICRSCSRPSDVNILQERVPDCIDEVSTWMMANRLQLNPIKTEVFWCSSARRRHQNQIPTRQVRVGNSAVLPQPTVCDLGVYIDADVTMSAHVTATIRACFAALRQIRSVRRSLTQDALLTLIRSLVITKLDFCCSMLADVSIRIADATASVRAKRRCSTHVFCEIRTHNSTSTRTSLS